MVSQLIVEYWVYIQQFLMFKPITLQLYGGQIVPFPDMVKGLVLAVLAFFAICKRERMLHKLNNNCPDIRLNIKGVPRYG